MIYIVGGKTERGARGSEEDKYCWCRLFVQLYTTTNLFEPPPLPAMKLCLLVDPGLSEPHGSPPAHHYRRRPGKPWGCLFSPPPPPGSCRPAGGERGGCRCSPTRVAPPHLASCHHRSPPHVAPSCLTLQLGEGRGRERCRAATREGGHHGSAARKREGREGGCCHLHWRRERRRRS